MHEEIIKGNSPELVIKELTCNADVFDGKPQNQVLP